VIKLEDIRKSFTIGPVEVEILKGVNLAIEPGELLAVVGSSGCGKSTLMNILGFLDTPTSGRYIFGETESQTLTDKELSTIRNEQIGFVFQQFHLLPRLTALDNAALPLVYRGVGESERRNRAMEMLTRVSMDDRADHKPSELSGGQQQRVAIARALAGSPSIILADEPTGALDTATSNEIMELFINLNREVGVTEIIITHDPGVAKRCSRAVRMKDGLLA
jgi:putative ABC transport system ATP-binding protein